MDEQVEKVSVLAPKLKKLDTSVVLLHSSNPEVTHPWTVIMKEGAVYQIGDLAHQNSRDYFYLCQYTEFRPKREDSLVAGGSRIPTIDLPPEVIETIEQLVF